MNQPPQSLNDDPVGQLPLALALFVSAPWWFVSLVIHTLLLIFFGLLAPAIPPDDWDCRVISSVDIANAGPSNEPHHGHGGVMSSSDSSPATLDGNDFSDIQVPADIVARAELGDHFETLSLDRPDLQSNFGDSDTSFFHSVKGENDGIGGGGNRAPDQQSYDDLIGAGSAVSVGSGGGWGGGDGDGTGIDSGSEHGSFGSRNGGGRRLMVKRRCGAPGQANCISLALGWLARHQEPDGHWDAVKNGARRKTDTAITGLALLAFLNAGHTERVGSYKDNVKRAVAWLLSQQHKDGSIYSESDAPEFAGTGYPMAIATLALCEAAGMSNLPVTKDAAQKAVNCLTTFQNADDDGPLGFRYRPHEAGDLSVTGWYALALKSAKVAGLTVDHCAVEGVLKFLDSVEIKEDAAESFTPPSHYAYQPSNPHSSSVHRLAAVGNTIRYMFGYSRDQLQSSVDWMLDKGGLPDWGAKGESVDLYYWYFGSMCVQQSSDETYRTWSRQLRRVLSEHQVHDGDETGSWPIVGDYSKEWGRVGQCAIACCCVSLFNLHAYRPLQQMK
jgi:hypothetical protein